MNHADTLCRHWLLSHPYNFSVSRAMVSRLLVSTFILAVVNCGAAAGSLSPLPLAIQDQIAALKKQNLEMHAQIEALKQQSRWTPSSRRAGDSATPPVMVVTNGKNSKASVQSLKWAIEAMNNRQ